MRATPAVAWGAKIESSPSPAPCTNRATSSVMSAIGDRPISRSIRGVRIGPRSGGGAWARVHGLAVGERVADATQQVLEDGVLVSGRVVHLDVDGVARGEGRPELDEVGEAGHAPAPRVHGRLRGDPRAGRVLDEGAGVDQKSVVEGKR